MDVGLDFPPKFTIILRISSVEEVAQILYLGKDLLFNSPLDHFF